jgi:hypothetical protein
MLAAVFALERLRYLSLLLLLLLLLRLLVWTPSLVSAQTGDSQPEPRTVRAFRLEPEESISLDGVLTEPVWDRAVPATGFRQQEPREGEKGSETTEVRIAFDESQLFLGVTLNDTEPDRVIGFQKQRDAWIGSDDRFMWILDTYRDGRTAYFFEINPAGLMGDGLVRVGSGDSLNKSWDGIWDARVRRADHGWTAEIRIPFRTLSFDPDLANWGINFQRTVRRKNEEMLWSGHGLNQGLFLPIYAGQLAGLEGLSQGLGLEFTPYAAGHYQDPDESGSPVDVGVDLSYSVTPNLRAAFTLNTDFAEVEVDDRQVNLTRFPLLFPERRDFFLEDSSVYDFARANGVRPYFSRRIGLDSGRPIPIVYGARLGGRTGRFDLGFLQVRTSSEQELGAEDFTVARVKRNILEQSSLGLIYTRRATGATEEIQIPAPADRHTVGVDLDLFSSRFLGDKNIQFEAFWVSVSDSLGESGTDTSSLMDRSARGVRFNYPNDRWRGHVSYREFGEDYDPAVGFVPRNGFRRVQPSFSFNPRPSSGPIRQIEMEVFYEHLLSLDNELLTRNLRLTPIGLRFGSGEEISVEWSNTFERLTEPFEIAEGVVLATGDYEFNDVSIDIESADHRAITGEFQVRRGAFWSGDRTALEAQISYRPIAGVELSSSWERNWIELVEGEFTTELLQFESNWAVNPRSSVTSILQFDNVSNLLGLYTRLRWILKPGSDLYLVYTQNWVDELQGFTTLDRAATTKVNYTHRF